MALLSMLNLTKDVCPHDEVDGRPFDRYKDMLGVDVFVRCTSLLTPYSYVTTPS